MKNKLESPLISNDTAIGFHGIWDISNCPEDKIAEVDNVKHLLTKLVNALDLNILGMHFHQFQPWGATGIMLLSESHISIHTWPERKYAAIDLFSCKNFDHQLFQKILTEHLGSVAVDFQLIERGLSLD